MSKKKSSPATEDNTSSISAPIASPLPLVLTISEVEALSPSDREKFRHSGGTAIQNPEA